MKSKCAGYGLGVAALALLASASASAATLARQCGAFGIVTRDLEPTVNVTKFHQSYPYTGRATVEYTVGGTLPANAVAEFTISTDDASATFVQSNIVAGANSHVIDFASSFGGALLLTNASFVATISEGAAPLGGVQLWAGGPYWAECNVGALAPEESGYYFWWGDTVGYTRSGGTWTDDYYYDGVTWVSSAGQSMGSSPFSSSSCPTLGKDNSALQSEGWIDAAGNLVAAHDAATAHLGAPWRMPTDAEVSSLVNNCDWTWMTKNGVDGYEVRGWGDYASNSIFLPAAGVGSGSYLYDPGSYGDYWSSSPYSDGSYDAWNLYFRSGHFDRSRNDRYRGRSVRPVRGFAGFSAGGVVTFDPAPIVIESVADWDSLSAAVAGGLETEGTVVLLACDVGPVTTTVGTAEHPFAGVFDGGSNTLTVALSGAGECVAPFARIAGATIRDLRVAGTVAGDMHCSGLVGAVDGGAANLVEGCEVAAAISCSRTHFGGFVGHGVTNAATLRGCVFSGSLSGGTCAATFNGWSDDGAATTLIDCLDASASPHPIGRGVDAACVSNTYYLVSKDFSNGERLWSEGRRGGRAYAVTGGEGVDPGFGEPLRAYGGSGLAVHSGGLARGGALYAEAGASIPLQPRFTGTPPAGMKHDGFAASAGTLSRSGDAWVLTMPAGDVAITATFAEATAYEIWAAANGVAGAWNETDASGIYNVFRYLFDKPSGTFENPPLLDIVIEGGNVVVITPPVSNTVGFAVSVVESSDVAGETVTARKPLDATGRTVFAMGDPASRFYRLLATEGDANPGGVQLWADGPYWAECNVGASAPEESGYYFWWGDTVGYTRSGGTWTDGYYYSGVTWVSSTGQSMGSSPFDPSSCLTIDKDNSTLRSEGWIDATGNLVAALDAATAHLGAPWRMPTDAEHNALISNCDWTWTTKNGVNGYEVRGRGDYASNSIFLPAAGSGYGSHLDGPGSYGYYWSSTPDSDFSLFAWGLYFDSSYFDRDDDYRYYGQSVRPVRDAD